MGCYSGGKWRKWLPKEELGVPSDCPDYLLRGRGNLPMVQVPDTIENLMEMQRVIMKKVPGGDIPELMAHQITCGLGIIEETLEYLNAIGRKPWRPNPLPEEDQLEELVDILHFFLEMIIRSPFTWSQMVEKYKEKHQENLQRYEKAKAGDYSWDKREEKREL